MGLLSIIIPAFNAGDTIQRCLDSIFHLPFPEDEFEVIVIDDCSTDDTVSLIERYAAGHQNLKLLRQTSNHRQGAARNRGIDMASGDYIAFVDSDDTVSDKGFINAIEAVHFSRADVCYYDFEFQTQDGDWQVLAVPEELRGKVVSSAEYLENHYTTDFNGPPRTIYRSEFLKDTGIRFVEDARWEDCDWTVKVYSRAASIQFVDGVGYRYWFNGGSTSKQRSIEALADRVNAGKRLMLFGTEIKDTLPRLSGTVFTEGKMNYVVEALRLRNLTKYSFADIKRLSELIGEEHRQELLQYNWPCWVRFFLRSKGSSHVFLSMACPVAKMGRSLLRSFR